MHINLLIRRPHFRRLRAQRRRWAISSLCDTRHLDWQVCDSELEAQRGYLRMDDHYVRVLTLKELPSEMRPLLL
jgi:hypothetical protein